MWYCSSCGSSNENSASFCTECGQPRPSQSPRVSGGDTAPVNPTPVDSAPVNPTPVKPAHTKRSTGWLWAILVVALLAGAAVVGFFTLHFWKPATCTEPETCSLCGKTRGEALGHEGGPATCEEPSLCQRCGVTLAPALGHTWQPATCTKPESCSRCGHTRGAALGHDADPATCLEPSVCRRCGQTVSAALGHDWQGATYDRPDTCSRCGETRGNVKGWVGDLPGKMGSESLFLYGDNESHPFIPDRSVNKCVKITLYMKITEYSGNPFGTWALFGKSPSGTWTQLTTFYVDKSVTEDYVGFTMAPSGYPSFTALSLVPLSNSDYSIKFSFYYEDVQEYVD